MSSPCQKNEKRLLFALKTLQKTVSLHSTSGKVINGEIAAHKRLISFHREHIVRLLATYTHQRKVHLVFPWADGTLAEFWAIHYPKPEQISRDHNFAKWMIDQVLGLADALLCIHIHTAKSSLEGLSPEDSRKLHGRHGDLKPENILWFRSTSSTSETVSLGTLKLSDLGSAEFHGTRSHVLAASAAGGYTNTYYAPEYDLAEEVSSEADLWSFGCILIQLIVWYMKGWDGLDDFSKRRAEDSLSEIKMDNFFNYLKYEKEVRAKKSVYEEINTMRSDPNIPDLLCDLLNIIESRLLRLRECQRATCIQIVDELKSMKGRCDSEEYCTQKTHRSVGRIPTDLSERVGMDYSQEMRSHYHDLGESQPTLSGNTTPRPYESSMNASQSLVEASSDSIDVSTIATHRRKQYDVHEWRTRRARPGDAAQITQVAQSVQKQPKKYTLLLAWIYSFFAGCFGGGDDLE
ncbi:kinase-like domain-containing protein [Alternaria alternata]|nr:kinase-like domain-containing protein [Alternaria alternata]